MIEKCRNFNFSARAVSWAYVDANQIHKAIVVFSFPPMDGWWVDVELLYHNQTVNERICFPRWKWIFNAQCNCNGDACDGKHNKKSCIIGVCGLRNYCIRNTISLTHYDVYLFRATSECFLRHGEDRLWPKHTHKRIVLCIDMCVRACVVTSSRRKIRHSLRCSRFGYAVLGKEDVFLFLIFVRLSRRALSFHEICTSTFPQYGLPCVDNTRYGNMVRCVWWYIK